jgi:hypothetical protein
MRGSSTDCIRDEACAWRKWQRGLRASGSTPSLLTTWTDQFAFGRLICDEINTDGGYVLASRVSVDFSESDLLQFFAIDLLQFFAIAAQQLVATPSLAQARASNSQPASWVQILSGHYNTAVSAPSRCNFARARCSISARCLTKIAMICAWPVSFLLIRSLFRRAVSVPGTFRFCRRTPQRNGRNRRQQQN